MDCLLFYFPSPAKGEEKDGKGSKNLAIQSHIRHLFQESHIGYTTIQVVSIPVVMMQNYKSVPDHLTEDDILSNIKQVEEDILEERIPNTRSKKRDSFSSQQIGMF